MSGVYVSADDLAVMRNAMEELLTIKRTAERATLTSSYNDILLNFDNYDITKAVEFIKANSAFCIEQMDTLRDQ
jgi:hypothetical protein